jgi:hypothetical protein
MIQYLDYSTSLPKQLRGLQKAGKKGESAACKCEAILNDIKLYGCQCEAVFSKRTRNGEGRIKNCVKYDLGGGYRLVTIRADHHLFICFVGSHDETNQWIEHHRYDDFVPGDPLYSCEEMVVPIHSEESSDHNHEKISDFDDWYENDLIARLDESQLKSIFQGLFINRTSPAEKSEKPRETTPTF